MHTTTWVKKLAICCCLFMAAVLTASPQKTKGKATKVYNNRFGLTAAQSTILIQIGRLLNLPCAIAQVDTSLAVTKILPVSSLI
jgi:hypothetical protein